MKGFLIALVVVFIILVFNFRSVKWGMVSYIPLLFTIVLIYGFIGFIGQGFDMPISVLSCLSLGMAVDFAIHFISRFKQRLAESPINTPNSELIYHLMHLLTHMDHLFMEIIAFRVFREEISPEATPEKGFCPSHTYDSF